MLNKIVIVGRMVREPEYRTVGSGISVCNFTLAVDRDFKGQDGGKETDFIDCVAWRQAAEFVTKYIGKGSMAAVAGRLQIDSYTDKDGNRRKSYKVNCDNVYSCGGGREATPAERSAYTAPGYTSPETYPAPAAQGDYALLEDDDGQLPF